jgi:putative transposase
MPSHTHYQRNLPHRLPPGSSLFLTMRLADSLPQAVIQQLQLETAQAKLATRQPNYAGEPSYARQKRYFGRFDRLLDNTRSGPTWLSQPAVAAVITGAMHTLFDCDGCQLVCYCVMSNHLHLVVLLAENETGLMRKLQRFKSYTAIQANRELHRNGQFWHRESYDHIIRAAPEMERVVAYVLSNPVKAGMVARWQDWPYTYQRP